MSAFLKFLARVGNELVDIFNYGQNIARGQAPDPDYERELAGRLIRKASDEAMLKELGIDE